MTVYLTLVGIVTVLYMVIPSVGAPLWALIGLGGTAAVLTGIRLHRPDHTWPWMALAAGLLAFTAGDAYYNFQEAYFQANNPFPSPADACYLAVYPLFAAGLFGLVRYRWVDRDVPSLLDALIVTAGLALPVWIYLVQPLAVEGDLTWQQRAISIAYPLGDVLVLAILLRLLAPSPGYGRNHAVRLLVLGTATLLCFDIAYGILQINGSWQAGTLLDSGWIVFYTAYGLAALHPDMVRLTRPEPSPQSMLPPAHRLLLLAGATLIAPAMLILEEEQGSVDDASVLAVFSTLLILLVIFRLTGMVIAHRKALTREQALGTATASLVAAVNPDEITRSCKQAVDALFGPETPHRTLLLAATPTRELYRHLTGPDGTVPPGTLIVPVTRVGPELGAELGALPTALISPLGRSDHSGAVPSGALLAAGPERMLAEMRDSLDILASHASLARDRIALRQEITRRQSEAYFRTLVRNASDVILIVDDDGEVRYASPSARAVFGSVALTGTPLRALVDPRDRDRVDRTLASLGRRGRQESHDHWWVLRGGERIEVEVRCRDLREDETIGGLVVTLRDVTEQRQLEHELTQRAFHDPLTGLPNRTLLLERTGRALLRGRRESVLTCLLFIDLDDFKIVNDTLGHAVGDHLLKAVSERLSESLRRTDTAARLGGDEFAVLMEDARQALDAELLAAQVIQSLNRPFRLGDTYVNVTASVGVATAQDSQNAEELLTLADLALYAAKAGGKLQWRRFEPRLRVRMAERHDLRARLDGAIAREEFALRYQPVVDISEGSGEDIVGFEALARWPHARRGLIPPARFIPLAEETGHITPLGAWVLRSATADMARLQQRVTRAVPPYVSVNVSGRQWREAGFMNEVYQALDTPGLRPGSLQLELTESVLMQRDEQIDRLIRQLKNLGVRIAVDDFGTGFSSLRYLREFPLDVLKIDKSFIDDIPGDSRQVALVEGIMHMAETIGLQVIAEGVEQAAQRDLLTAMGCHYGQGFLFARPMTAEQSEAALLGPDGNGFGPVGGGPGGGRLEPPDPDPGIGRPELSRTELSGPEATRLRAVPTETDTPATTLPETRRPKDTRLRAVPPETRTRPELTGPDNSHGTTAHPENSRLTSLRPETGGPDSGPDDTRLTATRPTTDTPGPARPQPVHPNNGPLRTITPGADTPANTRPETSRPQDSHLTATHPETHRLTTVQPETNRPENGPDDTRLTTTRPKTDTPEPTWPRPSRPEDARLRPIRPETDTPRNVQPKPSGPEDARLTAARTESGPPMALRQQTGRPEPGGPEDIRSAATRPETDIPRNARPEPGRPQDTWPASPRLVTVAPEHPRSETSRSRADGRPEDAGPGHGPGADGEPVRGRDGGGGPGRGQDERGSPERGPERGPQERGGPERGPDERGGAYAASPESPMTGRAPGARPPQHDAGTAKALNGERAAAGLPHPHPHPRPHRTAHATTLEGLRLVSPMSDAVLDEVRGRHIRSGDHWLIDFASCNYLGLDWDPEVISAVEPAVRRWGTHPSWSRLLGSPKLYPDIEERLTDLLGAEDTLLLPTITLIHAAVIPVLAGDGHVFVDATAHKTVYDGCVAARGQGATLHRCHAGRPDELDAQLRNTPAGGPRLVCLDGVDSMTGNVPDLAALAAVCRGRGATLYVDDAHGFGVIGQRGPDEPCRYGSRGNSVVRHTGESYDGIVLVGGFSKAYSSLLAFLALPTALKNHLKTAAGPYLYSGPSPTASLATTMAGLDVNDRRGDTIRTSLHRRTMRLLDHVGRLGLDVPCHDELPIVEIPLADPEDLDKVGTFLWDQGIYVTLAAHPLVPRDRVGFRVQVTALNSDADMDRLNDTLSALDQRGALRHRS
ncbi:aminotransferase class I/II-fold pyridoxal phosphate-dependent enzyme [Streptomyces sp. YIM S03343]